MLKFIPPIVLIALAPLTHAGVIGQWEGSGVDTMDNLLTWNSPLTTQTYALSNMRDLMISQGHTIGADLPLTAANLATYDSLVVRMPRLTPNATEMSALSDWVHAGGLLLMLADRNMNATDDPFNSIMAGVGSSIYITGQSVDQNFFFNSGFFLTDGPPYSLANTFASPTPGRWIFGGTSITHGGAAWTTAQQEQAAAYIHYQQIGDGYVIAFADTLDVNWFSPSTTNGAGRLFLNAANYINPRTGGAVDPPPPPPIGEVPEPATLTLALLGAAAFALRRR